MDEATRDAFREDGAVLIKGALNLEQLAQCRAAFDWAVENPGPYASKLFKGNELSSHVDNCNPIAKPRLDALMSSMPFGRLFADLWGSKHVWYFAEEIFLKEGGKGAPTHFHQDTSYLPWAGMHWGNAWISFEAVPKSNALQVVRGSHRGTRYDGVTFANPDDPTDPLHGGDALPRLPDIVAEVKRDPKSYDVLSWSTEPGDIVVLHPGSIHGGAPVDDSFPNRHTLVFRFFGDDATFSALPAKSRSGYQRDGLLLKDEMAKIEDGAPFRSPIFQQLC